MRRQIAALVAAILLSVAALPAGVTPAFAATYPGDCDAGTMPSSNYIRFKDWVTTGQTGVIATTVALDLEPCVNGSSKYGWTGVWVNLQNTSHTRLVQLGYIEVAAGYSVNGVIGRKFVWVPNPSTMGIFEPATWFQNGNPVVGHTYRFRIVNGANLGGGRVWQYCIFDDTAGTSGCKTGSVTTETSLDQSWWGFETANSKDVLGARSNAPGYPALLTTLKYQKSGSWNVLPLAAVCGSIGTQADYKCSEPDPSSVKGTTTSD
jgi:hypothetical protein